MTNFFAPVERGVQHAALRAANRRAVLTTIAHNAGMSNADISRHTGLAPQTASAIVTELENEGLILRGEVLRGRRGQPATPLYLNHNSVFGIGCEISWRHVEITLVSLGAREIAHYRRDYAAPDIDTIVDECATAIAELLEHLSAEERQRFIGIGVAVPSSCLDGVDLPVVPEGTPLPWSELDLAAELNKATGLATNLFHKGNAGAWGELATTRFRSPSSFAYIYVGCTIGAGIVSDNMLWETPGRHASNLGFLLVADAAGQRHYGHDVASICALAARVRAASGRELSGSPMDFDWESLEPHLSQWLADSGHALADIAINAGAAIGVDKVVIDGQLPPAILQRLLDATKQALAAQPRGPLAIPEVEGGRWGPKAISLGAAMLNFYKHFYMPDTEALR